MQARPGREVRIDGAADFVRHRPGQAVVFIDVLLSSTTLVTSAAQRRPTQVVASADEGRRRARGLSNPILIADPDGTIPFEFDGNSGPARLSSLEDVERPLLLLSPSAAPLASLGPSSVYVACLRNMTATVEALARTYEKVVLVAAGYCGQARCEDAMVAGWMAGKLAQRGHAPGAVRTSREIERWARADLSVLALGRGADHLRRLGRDADLDFVLGHVDDLDAVCRYQSDEVRASWPSPIRPATGVSALATAP